MLLNFQVCGLCFYLYMCVYICMHSCICICICPMTLFPTPALVWWCMCGQTTSALFISLHFTPRSSFSYNHCTYVDRPHTELVHTTFPPAKNWLRTVFIFSPLKRFDRRQKLGEERIGTWSLKVKTKIYRSNTFLSVLVFFGPQFFLAPLVKERLG